MKVADVIVISAVENTVNVAVTLRASPITVEPFGTSRTYASNTTWISSNNKYCKLAEQLMQIFLSLSLY